MKNIKKTIVLGFALFSMFFGASNVFLPSYIGARVGDRVYLSSILFSMTAIGLSLLAFLVVMKNKGDFNKLFEPLGKNFSKIFLILCFLTIGPIIAIPRTAATTYEMGIKPFLPGLNGTLVTLAFFLVCMVFCINKNDVLSDIGKYLTPILLISTAILIIFGIINKDKLILEKSVENIYSYSFLEGYNTLDPIASIIYAKFIYEIVKDDKNPMKIGIRSSAIAGIGLFLVYTGIMYLGNTANILAKQSLDRTELLVQITNLILGRAGGIVLGITVGLACLTTAVGLVASVSEFFYELLNSKIKYTYIVIVICFVSFLISQLRVDVIISMAVPMLLIFYPVLIAVILLNILKGKYINDRVIKYVTYITLILAIVYKIM